MKSKTVELGDHVKHIVSGFEGGAIGITRWLSGCDRIVVQPNKLEAGKVIESASFDVTELIIIEKGKYLAQKDMKSQFSDDEPPAEPKPPKPATRERGGPRPTPSRY